MVKKILWHMRRRQGNWPQPLPETNAAAVLAALHDSFVACTRQRSLCSTAGQTGLGQLMEQSGGGLQIGSVQPFSKSLIHVGEHLPGSRGLALLPPQATQIHGNA